MDKENIVIDLDGTFMDTNTFHQWMKFVFNEELKRFHFISILQIVKIIIMRYLKYIDHSQMKYAILNISEKSISEKQIISFIHILDKYVNKKLLKVLKNKSNTTILATAAPMQYATYIKDSYNFDYIIATGYTSEKYWEENIKEVKKENLVKLLQKYNLHKKISILYTDHHDDLPLMKDANLTYLVNPSKKTEQYILDANIAFKLY